MDSKVLDRLLSRLSIEAAQQTARQCRSGVTIVIPNWNHEYLLPRSISSALDAVKQLRRANVSSDILVIDDQSRDGSLTLLRQLEALYWRCGLRVMALARNGGPAAAQNRAIGHSSYRHVAFLDADNELVPENLPLFYRAAVETRAAVVYGNLIRSDRAGVSSSMLSNESFQHRMFQANYIDTFALLDRLQLADSGGYIGSAALHAVEDWELYLHLAANGRRLVFVPVVFGIYHELAGSMVHEGSGSGAAHTSFLRRVFDQLGIRSRSELKTLFLRYHPDIGYI